MSGTGVVVLAALIGVVVVESVDADGTGKLNYFLLGIRGVDCKRYALITILC
jgi:hypothetical protein